MLPALFFSLTHSPSSRLWERSQECWVTLVGRQPLGNIHANPFLCISQYLHVEAIMLYWTEFHSPPMLGSAQQNSLSAHRNVLERIIDFYTPCSSRCSTVPPVQSGIGLSPIYAQLLKRVMDIHVLHCLKLFVW